MFLTMYHPRINQKTGKVIHALFQSLQQKVYQIVAATSRRYLLNLKHVPKTHVCLGNCLPVGYTVLSVYV